MSRLCCNAIDEIKELGFKAGRPLDRRYWLTYIRICWDWEMAGPGLGAAILNSIMKINWYMAEKKQISCQIGLQFFHHEAAAYIEGAALMEFRRLDIQDPALAIGSLTAGDFNDKSEGVAFIEQT